MNNKVYSPTGAKRERKKCMALIILLCVIMVMDALSLALIEIPELIKNSADTYSIISSVLYSAIIIVACIVGIVVLARRHKAMQQFLGEKDSEN